MGRADYSKKKASGEIAPMTSRKYRLVGWAVAAAEIATVLWLFDTTLPIMILAGTIGGLTSQFVESIEEYRLAKQTRRDYDSR